MTEHDDHRIVSREDEDGTRHIAIVRRSPETDQLSDNDIITSLEEWRAKQPQQENAPDARKRWPTPASFDDWLKTTKPAPQEPCPECGCWSLRRGASPDTPGDERVVCTMSECEASPFYRPV
jgi:hypothetical protein